MGNNIKIFWLACLLAALISCSLVEYAASQPNLLPPRDLFSVSFPVPEIGWACGRQGIILHTSDGGITWSRQNSGTNHTLSAIYFVDQSHGWAVGDGGTILHTSDGGQTWRQQDNPLFHQSQFTPAFMGEKKAWEEKEKPAPYFLMDVHFVDRKEGWIATEKTTILHTADGGKTWEIQYKGGDFILRAIDFIDNKTGWAVGEYGYIYHTDDGGRTWLQQAGEYYISEKTGLIEGGYFLFDVYALDRSTAWVAGIDGYAALTSDGGATWRKVELKQPGTHLFTLQGDRKNTIVIGGNGILLFSEDAGDSFGRAEVIPSLTYDWIGGLAWKEGQGFAAVGNRGHIYLSDVRGDSWAAAGAAQR